MTKKASRPWLPSFLGYFSGWLMVLLVFFPVSLGLHFFHGHPVLVFVAACLSIIPLAGLMGRSTETLAERAGTAVGGLLNATFGNAAELIIGILAIQKGLGGVVKASLTGSIIGNLIFVMGMAVLAGGFRRKKQVFNRVAAGAGVTMLMVAVIGMLIPAAYHHLLHANVPAQKLPDIETMSLIISGVLILNYACGVLFTLKTHGEYFRGEEGHREAKRPDATDYIVLYNEEKQKPKHGAAPEPWWISLLVLFVSTVCVAVASELLVGAIEPTMHQWGLREVFVGAIIIAVVGNAAEHSTAVLMALHNKMDLAMQICIGSSFQVALFVTPVLVFVSLALGKPMTLEFSPMEILGIAASIFVVMSIANDGETNWFEGAQLLSLYALLAVAFFFV